MAETTRKVTLNVTKDDIKQGKRGNSQFCPIALALKRAVPEATNVDVSSGMIQGPDFFCWGWGSRRMNAFVDAFDHPTFVNWRSRRPFTEELEFKCESRAPVVPDENVEQASTGTEDMSHTEAGD